MPPYNSYFQNAQSAAAKWGLGTHEAERVCAIWKDVCNELNTTYANARTDEVEDYFTKKLPLYDDPSTTNSYDWENVEISKAEFKETVDIQRALTVLRDFSMGGQSQKGKAREDYKNIWAGIKRRVGATDGAERIAGEFNKKYCPDELYHYLQYLVKSSNPTSGSRKPWVFDHKGKKYLRVWHRKT